MTLTGVAALIAAVSFAVLACVGVYLAVRFTRELGDAATLVRETRDDQQALFARANAAVDRASAQLDKTEAATAAVADLGDSMSELAGQADALAGIGRPVGGAPGGGPLRRPAGGHRPLGGRRRGRRPPRLRRGPRLRRTARGRAAPRHRGQARRAARP